MNQAQPNYYPQPNPAPVYIPAQPRPKTDWLSIAQLVFSAFTFLGSLIMAGLMFFSNMMPEVNATGMAPSGSLLLIGYTFASVAVIALISGVLAIRRLVGYRASGKPAKRMVWLYGVFLLWPLLLWWGSQLADRDPSSGTMALVIALGLALPAIGLVRVGSKDLWGAFPQRDAGLLTFGAGFSMYLIMVLEILAIGALLVALLLFAPALPGVQEILQELTKLFQAGAQVLENPDAMERLNEMLTRPGVIGLLILAIGLIAPFIEELLKSLGVWFLADRKPAISPAQGYLAGMFSGAAFALVEGMFYGVQLTNAETTGQIFIGFMVGRAAGLLLHIFLSGLNGWALAKAWRSKRWGGVLGMLLLTTLIHGAWNSLAIINGVNSTDPSQVFDLSHPLSFVPMVLILLGMLVGFFVFSARVHRQEKAMVS